MRDIDRIIVMRNWIDNVKGMLNEKQLQEYTSAILMYGLYEEYHKSDDVAVQMALNFVLPQIDMMLDSYEEKKKVGQKVGRKKTVDDVQVWKLFREGVKGADIAKKLGKTPTAIYHSEGWQERLNDNYLDDKEIEDLGGNESFYF